MTLALCKLLAVCATFIILLRFRVPLWLTIGAGCMETALFSNLHPYSWPSILAGVLGNADFLFLCLMIFLIMFLSRLQDATGQSKKLVTGLERHLGSKRIGLVLFPALVGLLPMPGGALFSCPMVRTAAEGTGISERRKALINYWFRHIWELAWPLYPGYALICSLLQIPLTLYWRYTFPLVFMSLGLGCFFYLRNIENSVELHTASDASQKQETDESLFAALLNALPVVVTLVGAGVFGLVFDRLFPNLPGQAAFSVALTLGTGTALWQGRRDLSEPLHATAFNRGMARMMLLLLALFVFKDVVRAAGIVDAFNHIGVTVPLVALTFIAVPLLCGVLAGVMVGYVGMCFPILLGVLHTTPGLSPYTAPLIVLATVAGNCGQLLSPVHVCLVVTGEYFSISLPAMLRRLALPTALFLIGGTLWSFCLYFFNAHF